MSNSEKLYTAEDLAKERKAGEEEGIRKVYERVKSLHVVARSAYNSDSWDAGYHDALFQIEKSLLTLNQTQQ